MTYRREIDGLRALAVFPVILFHAGFQFFSGGFIGVDVFFVISGYLITTIIVSEAEQDRFSLINFYERRARRIMPALFVIVLACIPLSWVFLTREDLAGFSKSLVAVALFCSNVFFWRDGGYFETAAELKPLLHTWSLAVEEQYYLLFPPLLVFAWKFSRRWAVMALVAATILSLGAAQWGASRYPVLAFFLLPTRAWELAIGALAACYLLRRRQPEFPHLTREIMSLAGLLLIVGSAILFTKRTPFPGFYAVAPTVGAVLIILFATSATMAGRLLGQPVFVGIGLISYSAYLWHHPLFAFARLHYSHPEASLMLALSATSLALAALSWYWVERPFRDRQRVSRRAIFAISAVGTILLIGLGAIPCRHFQSATDDTEAELARLLARHATIYAGNIDERKFVKYRLKEDLDRPEVLILGSSRIMQVGAGIIPNHTLLNLAVSGCSLEDIIAISEMAMDKLAPELLLIGADPWLFNAKSGQDRWRSVATEYYRGLAKLRPKGDTGADTSSETEGRPPSSSSLSKLLDGLFRSVNISKPYSDDTAPGPKDKIRRDGSRIYNDSYASKTSMDVARGFGRNLNYAMDEYAFSEESHQLFREYLSSQLARRKVVLVLSPYHSGLYDIMETERKVFLETEEQFRRLAAELGITVLGSYDPEKAACTAEDFYDAMHPKGEVMKRVLSKVP